MFVFAVMDMGRREYRGNDMPAGDLVRERGANIATDDHPERRLDVDDAVVVDRRGRLGVDGDSADAVSIRRDISS